MTINKNPTVVSSSRLIRERVGLIVEGVNSAAAVNTIVAAEDAGIRQIWMSQPPNLPDVLTTFAARGIKDIFSKSWNIDCANLSTASTRPHSAGSGFTRYST